MYRHALRSLFANKRRLFGTFSATILGVAFLVGTLVLSDTMRASFDDIFSSANAGTDAVVRSDRTIGSGGRAQAGPVPESLVATLQAVPDVQVAAPSVNGRAQFLGADGQPVGGAGPPTLAGNWIQDPSVNPYQLVAGTGPTSDDEIVINSGAAQAGQLQVGSRTKLFVPDAVPVTVVGIANFGNAESLGGTTYAGLTLAAAQKYFGTPGTVNEILLQAKPGVSQTELVAAVSPVLPSGISTVTSDQLTADQTRQLEDGFLGLFRTFLLVFAGIALVVAAFSIYNTFTVVVAQRTRESALLRALGASRGQVVRSMLVESLAIGLVASGIGVLVGLLLAFGLRRLLDVIGVGLPPGPLVVTAAAVLAGLGVGLLVTCVASVIPSLKASRVAPLAALRDVAVDRSDASPWRTTIGALLCVAGAALLAMFAMPSSYAVMPRVIIGGSLFFLGVIVLGPVAAAPVGLVLGAPIRWLRAVAGRLATRNAIRNPRRTANTAAALLVGVCVVSLFTIFAASIKASIDTSVAGSFRGELVMSSTSFNGAGFSPQMIKEFGEVPGVAAQAPLGRGTVLLDGNQLNLTVTDPQQLGQLLDLPTVGAPLASLKPTEIAVSQETASQRNLGVGSSVLVGFANGDVAPMRIGSIYEAEEVVSNAIMSADVYRDSVRQVIYSTLLIGLESGASESQVQAQLQTIADAYGAGPVQTREQFIDSLAGEIDQLLGIVYVLLILAIVIALMGITNTLSLSIYERTREIGLIRAVGMAKGQARAMVRWEAVIIALFGTAGGLISGVVLGWAVMQALATEQDVARFSLPVSQLLAVAVVGGLVGVVAGLLPASRAARLNVLQAISVE